jgi:membrane-associated phospholipid phosphatase
VSVLEISSGHARRFALYSSLAFVLIGASLGGFAFRYDPALSEAIRSRELSGDLEKAVLLSEAFAHGSGVIVILLALSLCGIARGKLLQILILTAGAGVTANLMKSLFTRVRPYAREALAVVENSSAFQEMGSGSFWDASVRSFPSGHSATAVAFAIALSYVFPKARWLFLSLALAACYQRVYVGAHYPSDVLWGAVIAGVWGLFCLRSKWYTNLSQSVVDDIASG